MAGVRQMVFGVIAVSALATAPLASAVASPPGFGHARGLGFGHGVVGAVAGLVALPLVIASTLVSAAVSGTEPAAPYAPPPPPPPYPAAPVYAPPAGYYPPPPVYYAPASVYYRPGVSYYSRPPAYYAAPRLYGAPRGYTYLAPRGGYYGGYPAYPRR